VSQATAAVLGAIAGFTIFIGLPVARVRGLPRPVQGFLNALATGVLLFLLWDILSHAGAPVEAAMKGHHSDFPILILLFAAGIGAGLLSLIYFNGAVMNRLRGPGAAAGILVVGFALHNITEGFGIAAPMTVAATPVSWGFLALTGLIGGAPTFLGTMIGYLFRSDLVYVLFLALAAGAIIYVLNELFVVGRRITTPRVMGWGVLAGLLAAFGTDLLLVYVGG
jgi:ZIP family zinc transporter